MIRKLEHIGVMVSDMDRSIRFYTEIIGMRLKARERLANGTELAFLALPDSDEVDIELIGRGDEEFPANGRVNHIAFTVSDIGAELDRLKRLGVELIDEQPRVILDGVQIAFFYGPDGERLELFQPKA